MRRASNPGVPTFEQIRLFIAVSESGSFTAAARRLNRAVSAVSYGISNLEAQLGVKLFDRSSGRSRRLTAQGRAILADARAIGEDIDELLARVKGMTEGLEEVVGLAVDRIYPMDRLAAVLRAFQRHFPATALSLHVEPQGAVTSSVLEGRAIIGLSGPVALVTEGVECIAAGSVRLVPVAAPGHPLARQGRIAPGAIRRHVQLVLAGRNEGIHGQDMPIGAGRSWEVADLGSKRALLRDGLGWGNMPLPSVAADLASGALVRLHVPDQVDSLYRFAAVRRRDHPPGPAALWLLRRFVEDSVGDDDGASLARA